MSHCLMRITISLMASLSLFITLDASARSWRGDCAPDSRGSMPSGCLWQPLSTLISDEAHLICTGKLPTPNLINNLFEKAITNSKSKEDRECIKREKLRITELTKLQPRAFENREIQEAIRVAENEEQKKIDLVNAVKEREAAREEALSRLGEFTAGDSPVDRCQTIPPPAANDEKFVRSIVGLREGGGPNHLPYPSILETTNQCMAEPCTYRCTVLFDSQADPNSVSLALEELERTREAEEAAREQKLAAERAAREQKLAAEKAAEEKRLAAEKANAEQAANRMANAAASGDVLAQFANYIASGNPMTASLDDLFFGRTARIFDEKNCVVGYTDGSGGNLKIYLNKFDVENTKVATDWDTGTNRWFTYVQASGSQGLIENNLTGLGMLNLAQFGLGAGPSSGNAKLVLGPTDMYDHDRVIRAFTAVFSEVRACTGLTQGKPAF